MIYRRICKYLFLGFAASALLMSACASAKQIHPMYLPIPRAGLSCTFGPYRFGAIGLVVDGERDRPGPHGNEVKQIYRVFFVSGRRSTETVGFAGWLASTFDNKFWFASSPSMVRNRSAQAQLLLNTMLLVRPGDQGSLPLAIWFRSLVAKTHYSPTTRMQRIIDGRHISTAISACFSRNWNGK